MYKTAEEMQDALITKATEDADFRAELLADPKAVINKEFGIDIPDNIEVKVHESDLNTYHLSLPPRHLSEEQIEEVNLILSRWDMAALGQKLSEEQLEAVAGGSSMATPQCHQIG